MAKIKWGMFVVDGHGKVGGHVLAKNRNGSYVRTKVTPSNPQTTAQIAQRVVLSAFSQSWRNLPESSRLAWNGAVDQFSRTDIFGDIRNPTGKNLYTKLNINLSDIGFSAITLPPLPTSPDPLLECTLTSVGGVVKVDFTPSPVGTSTTVEVYATPSLSTGKYFVKSEYRKIGIIPSCTSAIVDITNDYVAKFGTPIA